jgi:hypothetical protein
VFTHNGGNDFAVAEIHGTPIAFNVQFSFGGLNSSFGHGVANLVNRWVACLLLCADIRLICLKLAVL